MHAIGVAHGKMRDGIPDQVTMFLIYDLTDFELVKTLYGGELYTDANLNLRIQQNYFYFGMERWESGDFPSNDGGPPLHWHDCLTYKFCLDMKMVETLGTKLVYSEDYDYIDQKGYLYRLDGSDVKLFDAVTDEFNVLIYSPISCEQIKSIHRVESENIIYIQYSGHVIDVYRNGSHESSISPAYIDFVYHEKPYCTFSDTVTGKTFLEIDEMECDTLSIYHEYFLDHLNISGEPFMKLEVTTIGKFICVGIYSNPYMDMILIKAIFLENFEGLPCHTIENFECDRDFKVISLSESSFSINHSSNYETTMTRISKRGFFIQYHHHSDLFFTYK